MGGNRNYREVTQCQFTKFMTSGQGERDRPVVYFGHFRSFFVLAFRKRDME